MKHVTPHELEEEMRRWMPQCLVSFDLQCDMYLLENPPTGVRYRITREALHKSVSLKQIAGHIVHEMCYMFDNEERERSRVGFYGTAPSPRHVAAFDSPTLGNPMKQPMKQPIKGRSFIAAFQDDLQKYPVTLTIEKENTKMRTEATCPACQAPEEQEITLVERTFNIVVHTDRQRGTSRRFVVNAFSRLDAIGYAIEILQDDVESGFECDVADVSAELMGETEILI